MFSCLKKAPLLYYSFLILLLLLRLLFVCLLFVFSFLLDKSSDEIYFPILFKSFFPLIRKKKFVLGEKEQTKNGLKTFFSFAKKSKRREKKFFIFSVVKTALFLRY